MNYITSFSPGEPSGHLFDWLEESPRVYAFYKHEVSQSLN